MDMLSVLSLEMEAESGVGIKLTWLYVFYSVAKENKITRVCNLSATLYSNPKTLSVGGASMMLNDITHHCTRSHPPRSLLQPNGDRPAGPLRQNLSLLLGYRCPRAL